MSRSSLLISLILILALIGAIFFLSGAKLGSPQFDSTKTVFFTSSTCADCQDTEALLRQHNIQFRRAEVNTPIVQAELQQTLNYCQLNQNQKTTLPFLFSSGTCLAGSPAIAAYLSQK